MKSRPDQTCCVCGVSATERNFTGDVRRAPEEVAATPDWQFSHDN